MGTVGRGKAVVMGFCRRGLQGAEPFFYDPPTGETTREREGTPYLNGRHVRAQERWIQEVDYRTDIVDIDQPDGRAIAASWGDVHFLLRHVEQLERTIRELRAQKSS